MQPFLHAHATHPDWRMALALGEAQLQAQKARLWGEAGPSAATLGFAYLTDHYSPHAAELLEALQANWPGVSWVGTVGVGVAASGVEYFDEPALVLMLGAVPHGRFRVFSGARRLNSIEAWTALVHADPATPDLPELIAEMSDRTGSGYLFGGLTASRGASWQLADGAYQGGLSGVAFGRDVHLISRVTQGSQPVGPSREVTQCEQHLVLELDGRPAMEVLAEDLQLDLSEPRRAIPTLRQTLVGLRAVDAVSDSSSRGRHFGPDVRVRHLIGLDPNRQAFAVSDQLEPGMRLAFCRRDVEAARRDLVRICSEIREELAETLPAVAAGPVSEPLDPVQRVAGALYVSCSGRGGAHFGGPSAELQIIQHALGDVPLVGFFAAGEIGHHHLYGYTGVLTVFVREP
jgi:small ligand-binding sensory domain FIST